MDKDKKCAKNRLILALDVDTFDEAKDLVRELKDYVGIFKVGLQLYTTVGPDLIKLIQDEGATVYFDGKFHDIPNTVAKASANLIKNGVSFFNVHIQGGSKMMKTTAKLAKETTKKLGVEKPTILGVSLLSSFGQRTLTGELCINKNVSDYVCQMAKLAKDSDLDGVIATASEAMRIKKECGDDFIVLCPAVRPTWSVVHDQIRVVTPMDAIKAGVDYLVIGRPITSADDRVAATNLIIDEIDRAINYKGDEELFI